MCANWPCDSLWFRVTALLLSLRFQNARYVFSTRLTLSGSPVHLFLYVSVSVEEMYLVMWLISESQIVAFSWETTVQWWKNIHWHKHNRSDVCRLQLHDGYPLREWVLDDENCWQPWSTCLGFMFPLYEKQCWDVLENQSSPFLYRFLLGAEIGAVIHVALGERAPQILFKAALSCWRLQ